MAKTVNNNTNNTEPTSQPKPTNTGPTVEPATNRNPTTNTPTPAPTSSSNNTPPTPQAEQGEKKDNLQVSQNLDARARLNILQDLDKTGLLSIEQKKEMDDLIEDLSDAEGVTNLMDDDKIKAEKKDPDKHSEQDVIAYMYEKWLIALVQEGAVQVERLAETGFERARRHVLNRQRDNMAKKEAQKAAEKKAEKKHKSSDTYKKAEKIGKFVEERNKDTKDKYDSKVDEAHKISEAIIKGKITDAENAHLLEAFKNKLDVDNNPEGKKTFERVVKLTNDLKKDRESVAREEASPTKDNNKINNLNIKNNHRVDLLGKSSVDFMEREIRTASVEFQIETAARNIAATDLLEGLATNKDFVKDGDISSQLDFDTIKQAKNISKTTLNEQRNYIDGKTSAMAGFEQESAQRTEVLSSILALSKKSYIEAENNIIEGNSTENGKEVIENESLKQLNKVIHQNSAAMFVRNSVKDMSDLKMKNIDKKHLDKQKEIKKFAKAMAKGQAISAESFSQDAVQPDLTDYNNLQNLRQETQRIQEFVKKEEERKKEAKDIKEKEAIEKDIKDLRTKLKELKDNEPKYEKGAEKAAKDFEDSALKNSDFMKTLNQISCRQAQTKLLDIIRVDETAFEQSNLNDEFNLAYVENNKKLEAKHKDEREDYLSSDEENQSDARKNMKNSYKEADKQASDADKKILRGASPTTQRRSEQQTESSSNTSEQQNPQSLQDAAKPTQREQDLSNQKNDIASSLADNAARKQRNAERRQKTERHRNRIKNKNKNKNNSNNGNAGNTSGGSRD